MIRGACLYKIQKGSNVQILSPEEMKAKGYQSQHNYTGAYFYFRFGKKPVSEFMEAEWNYTDLPGNNKYGRPFVVTLKQLKQSKCTIVDDQR